MSLPTPQVKSDHYTKSTYLNPERWLSYWHQVDAVRKTEPKTVLEIGVGNGLVRNALRSLGYTVQTADIDPALQPDVLASVTALPFDDDAFDCVLCAEVLEHLPFEEARVAMKELRRVSKKHAVITLPHSGYVFTFITKLPLFPWMKMGFKIPHFWKRHAFNGQHYWECGKYGWPRSKITEALQQAGFEVKSARIQPDDPSHVIYECVKR